jgi:hypothetical protein
MGFWVWKIALVLMLCMVFSVAQAAEPTQGYYAGLSIFYPYKPVYCDQDELGTGRGGACYGSLGDLLALPKSAPLPYNEKWCKWVDRDDPASKVDLGNGWASITGEGWYQWDPRLVPEDKQSIYGARVCYFEDRGTAKNINDLKRE